MARSNDTTVGVVVEGLPSLEFLVRFQNEKTAICYLAGKMRLNYVKVIPGDKVSVVLSPDGARGRIMRRL